MTKGLAGERHRSKIPCFLKISPEKHDAWRGVPFDAEAALVARRARACRRPIGEGRGAVEADRQRRWAGLRWASAPPSKGEQRSGDQPSATRHPLEIAADERRKRALREKRPCIRRIRLVACADVGAKKEGRERLCEDQVVGEGARLFAIAEVEPSGRHESRRVAGRREGPQRRGRFVVVKMTCEMQERTHARCRLFCRLCERRQERGHGGNRRRSELKEPHRIALDRRPVR
ncbi:hypothetical protein OUZ56_032344 [Daphnia magna]|uniref:Uncharacterized protein n=1 Tax=Daphnia magna TaxID=35525 RepID=A0ABR0B8M9_9CRUS|nr:hypothetical protein OUZ56_032344 [Daphnia magna]